MEDKSLDKLKVDYSKIEKKYNLPSFEKLKEDFDMEKISDKGEGILIRDVRRVIIDKIASYLHLFENLINPSNPPMFVFSFMKNLNDDNKKEIKECYKELSKLQLANLKLDTIYSEKNEADFILLSYKNWQELKKRIHSLMGIFEREFERNSENKEKSYFG